MELKKPMFRSKHLEKCLNEKLFPNLLFWVSFNMFCVNIKRVNSRGWTPDFGQHYRHWDQINFQAGFIKRKPSSGKKYFSDSRHRYKVALHRLEDMKELERVPDMDQGKGLIVYRLLPETGRRSPSYDSTPFSPSSDTTPPSSPQIKQAPRYLCLLIPLKNKETLNKNLLSLAMENAEILKNSVGPISMPHKRDCAYAVSGNNDFAISHPLGSKLSVEPNSKVLQAPPSNCQGNTLKSSALDSSSQMLRAPQSDWQGNTLVKFPALQLSIDPVTRTLQAPQSNWQGNALVQSPALQLSIENKYNVLQMSTGVNLNDTVKETSVLEQSVQNEFVTTGSVNAEGGMCVDEELPTGINQDRGEYKMEGEAQCNSFEQSEINHYPGNYYNEERGCKNITESTSLKSNLCVMQNEIDDPTISSSLNKALPLRSVKQSELPKNLSELLGESTQFVSNVCSEGENYDFSYDMGLLI